MGKITKIFQNFIMLNPKIGMWFLSYMPASFWEKQGRKRALATFYEAAEKVPAYQKFLREKEVNPKEIKTFEDFQKKVPIMDKENYILKNKIEDLCLGGRCDKMYTLSTSSGSLGKSSFWFRTSEQDFMLPKYWELFLLQNWDISQHSTLFIVTMDLGNWIAGELVSTTLKRLALEGKYSLTIATPGADIEQILDILKRIGESESYEQIILAIYPSLIKPLLERGIKEGIRWENLNIRLWVGGERFPAFLKKYILDKLNLKREEPSRIAFVYGTAEAGGIGFSSPLSNLIAKWASQDDSLKYSLFGKISLNPPLLQINPLAYFVEEKKRTLLITYRGGIPLIRYNTHDEGGIIGYPKIFEILKKHGRDPVKELEQEGYKKEKMWKWPFLYIIGRKDNVVKIIGANIYPENIEATLYEYEKETEMVNSFRLKVETDQEGNTRFYILIELKEGIFLTQERQEELRRKYHDIFLKKLLEINSDFRGAYKNDSETANPIIKIYYFGQGPFERKLKTKAKLIEK